MSAMRSFAETFFSHFGAQLQHQDGELVVDLPPHLADAFGKPRLYLVFPTGDGTMRELSPTEDLLVYGSRVFDRMLALLAGRGEVAQLQLPSRVDFKPGDVADLPLPLHHCRLLDRHVELLSQPVYLFNFRAIYRSTEKQEELVTIALDSNGLPRPDLLDFLTGSNDYLPPDQPRPVDPGHLQELVAQAGEAARQHAATRAAAIEEAGRPGLEKALLRLTAYYRRLQNEVHPTDPAQAEAIKADLQRDLAQKIADEVERHRLRITLRPISYALGLMPVAHYRLTLATRHTRQTVTFAQNLHTGQVENLTCHHCRRPLDQLALCDRQHTVHPDCLETCGHCRRDICRACGIQPCAMCGSLVCVDCVARCHYCQHWLCATHIKTCAICGAPYCPEHSSCCDWCGQTYCHRCLAKKTCQTCHAAMAGETITPPEQASLLSEHYQWQSARNNEYTIYFGQPPGPGVAWRSRWVIVVNQAGQVVYRQKVGAWRWFWARSR
ncbi:MAG: hypothetical protein JW953_02310 [Anaerolineae bacterium]|nr:hypothetical protein [Anaerolineae bacterium]